MNAPRADGARGSSLLDRVRADGASADVPEVPADRVGDPDRLAELLREVGGPDCPAPDAVLEQAGALHDPETLDEAFGRLGATGLVSRMRGRRRRLHEAAQAAVAKSADTGTVQLCCALLGEVGGVEDVPVLEALGTHPALTLHACTALTAMGSRAARESLLRMLARTTGAARLLVADRLLLSADEPAVRVALVRDTLPGLSDEQADEIAPYIAVSCRASHLADDSRTAPDVRAGARRILEIVHARQARGEPGAASDPDGG